MRDILFIRLLELPDASATAETTPVEWLVRSPSPSGNHCTVPRRSSLLAAATEMQQRQVVVIAPNSAVLLTQAILPPRSGSKIQRIVPFLLEDQLADDISNMHFAVGKKPKNSQAVPVAVVSDDYMLRWQTVFSEAELRVDALVPAPLCVENDHEASATVLVDGEHAWVHTRVCQTSAQESVAQSYFCDLELLPVLLPSTLADQSDDNREHEIEPRVVVLGTAMTADAKANVNRTLNQLNDHLATNSQNAERLDITLQPDRYTDSFTALASGWQANALNLLQGEYSGQANGMAWLKTWGIAAGFLIFLGLIATIYQSVQVNQLQARSDLLAGEINRVFLTVLPNDPILDARAQVEQALTARAPQISSDPAFLTVYQAIAKQIADKVAENSATNNSQPITIQQLNWRNGKMELELRLADVQLAEQLKTAITSQTPHRVSIASVNAIGDRYKVKMSITAAQPDT